MKKRILSAILALSLMAGLAACSGNTNEADNSKEPDGNKEEKIVFNCAGSTDMGTWDQCASSGTIEPSIFYCIYDTLVKATDHKGTYDPGLATDWSVSEDGLSWTFHLQEGVTFHNGEKFTSADVKYTFERMANDESLYDHQSWATLDHVDTPDDMTAVFVFTEPYGAFLARLSLYGVLPDEACTELGEDFWNYNYGTGPFKFVSWQPGTKIVMEKNEDYWGENKSNVDEINYYVIADSDTRVAGIRTGEYDYIFGQTYDQYKQLQGDDNITPEAAEGFMHGWIGLGTQNGIFDDENARLAVAYGIDRELLCQSVVSGGIATSWPTSTEISGGKKDAEVLEYDLEKAKEYLAKSDYDGREISIISGATLFPNTSEIVEAIASMLTEIGFNVKIDIMENATFQTKRSSGEYDMMLAGVSVFNGDPYFYINQHLMNDGWKSGLVDGRIVDLIAQSNVEIDEQKRSDLIEEALQIVVDDAAPQIHLFAMSNVDAKRSNISGILYFPDQMVDFSNVVKE